ncbi:protein S-nitrosylase [Rhodovastum atsumiense]|uniref:Hydroxylamine reductase n=1 Tax=Rhodovastum atsumiense TaxID=504468 RepID=A0A5M6IQR5_9PROT|nr:hydroxylamine reductase [Rhodovastum atsumiense]KAA5610277.1 hydroxylamine reductase [Rhodovastum atsumiense]CAH2602236.1 protein S-nitrosylase [Rhodovastum atsumiense]
MFCHQCEQTARSADGDGCASTRGNCGKDATTADLQDLLIHAVKGLAQVARAGRGVGIVDREVGRFISHAVFTTLTNVNFTPARFIAMIGEAVAHRERLLDAMRASGGTIPALAGPATFRPATDLLALLAQAPAIGIRAGEDVVGPDVIGLRSLLLYGLKGVSAYVYHARVLGAEADEVYAGLEDTLDYLAQDPTDLEDMLAQALALGRLNLTVMEMLDAANISSFGIPEPTVVAVTPRRGKAILVSGHDMLDLTAILEATAGKGINVYTHGEMLPANAYPVFKKYPHLAGNYGGAWQEQQAEFSAFPGPIVMTSNCLIEPRPAYRQRIFTTGPVGWPGLRHIENRDFAPVIAAALALPGFTEEPQPQTITIGFARHTVLGVADKVIDAVKAGAIRHFFLVGGCDGAAPGRNYYTEFAEGTPQDTVVMTLGCGKYRFNRHEFGDIGGIPRLLDLGQCNDSYSAIRIAGALAEAFGCGINDLPLSLVVSWFEQKAAAVLLTLVALGVRNIRLGPTLPAFLTPTLIGVLVERFGIQTITTAEADIAASLQRAA